MDFAVTIKGLHEDDQHGAWVLAVDGDRVLVAHDEDKSLHWHPLKDCTFMKAQTPDQPVMVMSVAPNQQGKIVKASSYGSINGGDNRMARRRRGA